MATVGALIEKLVESPAADVTEAGAQMLRLLSDDRLSVAEFLDDPLVLLGPPYFSSRYLAQVTLRALREEYDSIDDVLAGLQALIDRNPPTLEPKRQAAADRILLPEMRVLEIRQPARHADGAYESGLTAMVTSGPMKDREIDIHLRSTENPAACQIVSCFWVHAGVAAYNLVPAANGTFTACTDTFFVLEPMRQVNATSIARSLHCTKPQFDQMRRGKGDVTIHTLKGQLVHNMFDRMLEGETDLDQIYAQMLPSFLIPLASVTDEFFSDDAFRADVLRHTLALREFVEQNPKLLENAQLELKRYSATIGIQGRIDAVFREGNRIDILELKTGKQIRPEDHAQVFIYRLLLSDLVRRCQRGDGQEIEVTTRLLSSTDGALAPVRLMTDFHQVLDARNKLISLQHGLGRPLPHGPMRYEGFDAAVCSACVSWTRRRCKDTSDVFGDRPGAVETPELQYFRRLTRLIERERWSADQDLADLLDDSRLEHRVRTFRAIRGVHIVSDAEPFTFQFERNTSDLEHGDSVLIHSGSISSTALFHGYVRSVEPRHIRVSVPLKNLTSAAFADQDWIIDRFPRDVTAEASHTALYDFLVAPADAKKHAILEAAPEAPVRSRPPEIAGLNPSQSGAVQCAVECETYHLIWGPPGTGKTKVIPEIVRRVSGPVLLGAFTNTAVDKMLLAVLDGDPGIRFIRFGRSSESHELAARLRLLGRDAADCFTEDLALKLGSVSAVKTVLYETMLVAATAHRASTLPFLRTRPFELSILDEAGQLTEPLTLGLILRSRRFVLIGDDRQLPPVVRTRELATSMFERFKRRAEREAPHTLTMLDTQYRMHPDIMDVSNRLFYDGRLRAGVTAAERLSPDGAPVVFIPVLRPEEGHGSADDRTNPAEAQVIHDIVQRLTHDHRIAPERIGVVSPFRAQVVLLRQKLSALGVSVDTVERFQGGERDIMILSFVRTRGTGFVFDERRLNVAITRARTKLVLVAHPELFRHTKYEWISTFTETLKTAGTT